MHTCQIGLRWSSKVSGGAERIFSDLAAGLPSVGVSFSGIVAGVPALAAQTGGLVHAFAREDSGTLTRLRGARTMLRKLLVEQKPDIVASHFALYTAPILDQLRKQRFVMHFHGPWALESRVEGGSAPAIFAKRRLERAVYSRADRAIVLSRAFARLLHETYSVAEDRIDVVPGAVDLRRFNTETSRESARAQLGWPLDRPTLLTVRRLVHRMGLPQLVQAIAEVRARVPDVLLHIAGTGPLRTTLETLIAELGLQRHVRLVGFVPEERLALVYRAADVSVVPTLALEGFGLVAAESLAAGTPAMVTPVGGLPEVVQDLSQGLLFRSGNPAHLADGLIGALRGEAALPTEAACRAFAEQRFSTELMCTRVAAVYRAIL